MKKSNKGFVPIMVKPETKQLVKDLMPGYEDTYDATILILLRDRESLRKALEQNKKLYRESTEEIERLKKQIRGHGEVMEAEAGRE